MSLPFRPACCSSALVRHPGRIRVITRISATCSARNLRATIRAVSQLSNTASLMMKIATCLHCQFHLHRLNTLQRHIRLPCGSD